MAQRYERKFSIKKVIDWAKKNNEEAKNQTAIRYDPLIGASAASPEVIKKTTEFTNQQIKAGIKAPFQKIAARYKTRKNIKSMANTAAEQQLAEDRKNLPANEKSSMNLKRRQDAAYKKALKDLKNQIPRRYR